MSSPVSIQVSSTGRTRESRTRESRAALDRAENAQSSASKRWSGAHTPTLKGKREREKRRMQGAKV